MSVKYIEKGKASLERTDKALLELKIIQDWKPESDVWPIRLGGFILGGASVISSVYITNTFRRKFKLKNIGRPIIIVPTIVSPIILGPILHQHYVTIPMLLRESCPICVQVRSALIQSHLSVVLPLLSASAFSFYFSYSFGTYRFPALKWSSSREYFSIWLKMCQPMRNVLPWHIVAQMALSFLITQLEAKSIFSVKEKLRKKEMHPSVHSK